MKTYRELLAEKRVLDQQIEQAKNAELSAAFEEIYEKMAAYGISIADLAKNLRKLGTKTGAVVAPKYRNPDNGATWSGRGKAPQWIAGKDRSRFEIR